MVVEDDAPLREAIVETLSLNNFKAKGYESGIDSLRDLNEIKPSLIISDIQMNTINGLDFMASVHTKDHTVPVLLITAHGSVDGAVSAIKAGAKDYLLKPFEPEVLIAKVEKHIKQENNQTDHDLIANDPSMLRIVSLAKKVSKNNATLMISGESGTGKEVLSRFIHQNSERVSNPFVAINCAAIPENMLEATLFGYEKGAFTGAYQSCPGKFELAQGGTILLDEISEMDLALQAKLLRVLQEKEVERLGGKKSLLLDIRVIATSNRNLLSEVKAGRFREDLYYRLNVFPLRIPSLRERVADILEISLHFLKKWNHLNELNITDIHPDAIKIMESYQWPGNVRELENVIQRAIILSVNNTILPDSLVFDNEHTGYNDMVSIDNIDMNVDIKNNEYQFIITTLESVNWSRKAAAIKLGVSERTLRYKLSKMRDLGYTVLESQPSVAG